MSWGKIKGKQSKPIKWWYHKLLSEFGWAIRNSTDGFGWDIYYKHLNAMVKQGFNLYGEKI